MPTKAKKDGNARHIAKLDVIKIQPYKEEGAAIRAAAKAANKSVQGYVLEAVREHMGKNGASGVPSMAEDGAGVVSINPGSGETTNGAVGASPTTDDNEGIADDDLPF